MVYITVLSVYSQITLAAPYGDGRYNYEGYRYEYGGRGLCHRGQGNDGNDGKMVIESMRNEEVTERMAMEFMEDKEVIAVMEEMAMEALAMEDKEVIK